MSSGLSGSKRTSGRLREDNDSSASSSAPASSSPLSAAPQKKKKKRRSGDAVALGMTANEERYAKATLKNYGDGCYLGGGGNRPRPDDREAYRRNSAQVRPATAAAAEQRRGFIVSADDGDDDGTIYETDNGAVTGEGLSVSRRHAIRYLFVCVFGSPPESEWGGRGGTIAELSRRLDISPNSARLVRVVLDMAVVAEASGDSFTGKSRRGGRAPRIKFGSPEAAIVLRAAKQGLSISPMAIMVNEYLLFKFQDPVLVSWSSVRSFLDRSPAVITHKRGRKQQGNDDPGSCERGHTARALDLPQPHPPPPPPPPRVGLGAGEPRAGASAQGPVRSRRGLRGAQLRRGSQQTPAVQRPAVRGRPACARSTRRRVGPRRAARRRRRCPA